MPNVLAVTWNLVLQQLAMRYRRVSLGLLWVVLVPLLSLGVMAAAVSFILGVRRADLILHLLVSLLPYTFFAAGLSAAAGSLLGNQEILRRHAIHRGVFPASALLMALIEHLAASSILLVLGPMLGVQLNASALAVLLGFACLLMLTIGLGLLFSIATVLFRDLAYLLQLGLTLLYWVTPILYGVQQIPEGARKWFWLNPLYGILQLYTEPLERGQWPSMSAVAGAMAWSVSALAAGAWVFHRRQRRIVYYL